MKKLWTGCAAALLLSIGLRVAAQDAPKGVEFVAPDEMETRIIKVLRTTNKAQTNRYVPKAYTFEHANPYDVLRFIRRAMEIEEGAWWIFAKPTGEELKDGNVPVKGGKVVVVAPTYQIPYLDKLMAAIDRPGLTTSSGDEAWYYRPRHRHVQDADFTNLIKGIITPNHSGGDQVPDNAVNGFLFYDSPSGIEDIQRWMPLVDVPPAQVMIEASVYEVNVENDDSIGLDFVSWKNGPGAGSFQAGAYRESEKVSTLKNGTPPIDTGVPGGTYGLPGHRFRARGNYDNYFIDVSASFFDFLVTKQKARVLTSAKLCLRNGVTGRLSAGESIFYWRTSTATNDQRVVTGQTQARELAGSEAGVFLEVTPVIGLVGVDLAVEVDIVSHTGFDASGRPQLAHRNVDTEVRVKDGDEIVLGGYSREMMIQQSSKVPFLGSIPGVGWLFGSEQNLVKKRRVVLVLNTRVVRDFSAMRQKASQIDAALIRARARRDVPVENLKAQVGFDQWLLDRKDAE